MRWLRLLLISLILLGALAGIPGQPCAAPPLTLGLASGPQPLTDPAGAQRLSERLALRLGLPVKLRLFDDERQLHEWLSRFREVDCGWLSAPFLTRLPAGEVLPLVAAESRSGVPLDGLLVARQGLDAALLARVRSALLVMAESPDDVALLAELGLTRFVAAAGLPAGHRELPVVSEDLPPEPLPEATPSALPDIPAAGEPPITLAADQLELQRDPELYEARGDVRLEQGATSVAADRLIWQAATRDAAADGAVRLQEANGELEGSRLRLNLGSGRGTIEDGRMFLRERNFHLAGEEIERLGESSYRVSRGRFTTCDGEIPDWQFSAAEVDVTIGHYATARDVWFEVRNQPLLYLPYLVFPVKAERESGFLLPRAGYSSRKGALLSLAWYQVIDRNLDATVHLDYLSELGLGKGLEYRYAFADLGQGEALFYHISGFGAAADSYAIDWQHDGMLPGAVRLAADLEYVNKRSYFENFGESATDYTRDQTVSTVLLQRNWEKLNVTTHARYIRDLDNGNAESPQRLPELGIDLPAFRLAATPFYVRTEARATNFAHSDIDGRRLLLRQGLGAVFKPGDWLEFSPEVALQGRVSHTDADDDSTLQPEVNALLSTRLLRVFPFARWGFDRLQHSIEPQVGYRYIAEGDQGQPLFDSSDRIGPFNLFEYALVNRLTARAPGPDGTPSYRELLNLRLAQSYDVRSERNDVPADGEPFSDLRAELTVRPSAESLVEVDTLTQVSGAVQFNRVNIGGGFDDGHGDRLRLDYRYRRSVPGLDGNDYLHAELATGHFAPVYLTFQERYDLRDGTALESLLGIEYRARCWSIYLTLRDRPDDQEVLVGFALSGLGRVGGYGSTLRAPEE